MRRDAERVLDEYLAACARDGDRKAFGQLAQRWQPRLLRHASRLLGDAEAARDAAQEAWLEIVRGIGRLEDSAAFPAWAFRIATRRCARAIGGLVADRRLRAEAMAELPGDIGASDPIEAVDAGKLAAAVRLLPPEQRAAVSLFYFEDLGVAETAVALGVPAGTVKTRLMHARRKLRDTLDGGSNG